MKFIFLMILSLAVISCASSQREPSSTQAEDVSEGINADYYGGSR